MRRHLQYCTPSPCPSDPIPSFVAKTSIAQCTSCSIRPSCLCSRSSTITLFQKGQPQLHSYTLQYSTVAPFGPLLVTPGMASLLQYTAPARPPRLEQLKLLRIMLYTTPPTPNFHYYGTVFKRLEDLPAALRTACSPRCRPVTLDGTAQAHKQLISTQLECFPRIWSHLSRGE